MWLELQRCLFREIVVPIIKNIIVTVVEQNIGLRLNNHCALHVIARIKKSSLF
jgi:hypothetical protein